MLPENNLTKPQYHYISVRLLSDMYEQLQNKMRETGCKNISDLVRSALDAILDSPPPDKTQQYLVSIHTMIKEAILGIVDNGPSLLNKAEQQAAKIMENWTSN